MPEINEIFSQDEPKKILAVNDAISKTDDSVLKFTEDINKLVKILSEQGITLQKVNEIQKQAVKTNQDLDVVGKQLQSTEEKLRQIGDDRQRQIVKNKQLIQEQNKILKDEAILNDKNSGLLEKAAASNRLLEAQKRKLTGTEKDYAKQLSDINKKQDANNKIIADSSNTLQKQKINIGNYKSALEGAGGALGQFTRGLKAMLANPVILIVAGIVGAFRELKQAFESSDKGRELLAKGLGLLKGVSQVIFNLFSKLADILIGAFENPKQAVIDLWDIIKTNIVNRFTGLIDLFKAVGNGLQSLWKRDIDGLKNAAKEAGIAIVQMSTGLDELQQKNAAQKIADGFKESNNLINQSIDLQVRELKLREAQINFITKEAELNRDIVSLRTEASDQTVSAAKRLENIALIEEKVNQLVDQQSKLKKEELSIITLRNSLGKNTLDDTEKEKQLQADLIKLEETRATEQRALVRLRSRALDQLADDAIAQNLQNEADALGQLSKRLVDGQINAKQYNNELDVLTKNSLKNQIDAINYVLDNFEITEAKRIMLTRQRINIENQLYKEQASQIQELEKEKEDKEKEKQKENQKLADEWFKYQIDKQKEQAEKEREIAREKANQIVEITEQLSNVIEDFATGRIKSFKEFSKQLLLIALESVQKQIILSQVEILAKEIASKSFAGIATSALLIAGIQIAFAGAKAAIQAFETGTNDAPSRGIFGEKGRELMKLRSGELIMADRATYFEGSKYKGATIYTNRETEKIIAESNKRNSYSFDTSELRDGLNRIEKAIQRKPVAIQDKSGKIIGLESSNYREIYLNRLRNGR